MLQQREERPFIFIQSAGVMPASTHPSTSSPKFQTWSEVALFNNQQLEGSSFNAAEMLNLSQWWRETKEPSSEASYQQPSGREFGCETAIPCRHLPNTKLKLMGRVCDHGAVNQWPQWLNRLPDDNNLPARGKLTAAGLQRKKKRN